MTRTEKPELPSYEQARALVEEYARGLGMPGTESVALLESDGRVLAEEIRADRDFPPFDRATRDGFAVRTGDIATVPARMRVLGEIAAGSSLANFPALSPNTGDKDGAPDRIAGAFEIMTGAPLPEGANAVVMVEYTRREGEYVIVERAARKGENFVPRGAEARADELLLHAGEVLNPAAVAIAASVGKATLRVYRRPAVAVLATGDELVEVAERPGPAQIRNSNSYSLATQVRRAGGEARILPIARDHEEAIRQSVEAALACDLLVLSGGVSMGKYDLVEKVLQDVGAQLHLTGARIQPGKPVVFGTLPRKGGALPFFGLPGNPISTMVTFDLFVAPVLAALAGRKASPLRFAHATMNEDFKTSPGLTRFLPAVLSGSLNSTTVSLVPWHGSGDLAAIVRANCYLVVPSEATVLAAGLPVTVLLKD